MELWVALLQILPSIKILLVVGINLVLLLIALRLLVSNLTQQEPRSDLHVIVQETGVKEPELEASSAEKVSDLLDGLRQNGSAPRPHLGQLINDDPDKTLRLSNLLANRLRKAAALKKRIDRLSQDPKLRLGPATLKRIVTDWKNEKAMLERVEKQRSSSINFAHLSSTNLSHIEALVSVLEGSHVSDVCQVQHRVNVDVSLSDPANSIIGGIRDGVSKNLSSLSEKRTLTSRLQETDEKERKQYVVDVVCNAGMTWITVVARNPLQLVWEHGDGEKRRGLKRKILKLFRVISIFSTWAPETIIALPDATPVELIDYIHEEFCGERVWCDESSPRNQTSQQQQQEEEEEEEGGSDDEEMEEDDDRPFRPIFFRVKDPGKIPFLYALPKFIQPEKQYINFDTATLVALVSDLCNGAALSYSQSDHPRTVFHTDQAEMELQSPVVGSIMKLIRAKQIFVTAIAKKHFVHIVDLIEETIVTQAVLLVLPFSKQSEKVRAEKILSFIPVLEDVNGGLSLPVSPRIAELETTNTVGHLQRQIFGISDCIPNMTTTTSNRSFVRVLEQMGVFLRVELHDSRALLTRKHDFAGRRIDEVALRGFEEHRLHLEELAAKRTRPTHPLQTT